MVKKVFECKICNEQFLQNEWRWKRITLPIFIVITTFTVMDYPVEWKHFHIHAFNTVAVILCLWVVNRFIIVKFHKSAIINKTKRKRFFFKYLLTIVTSLSIVYWDIVLLHEIFDHLEFEKDCPHDQLMDILIVHRYLFLITILFAYFINANYERLFMFIELTETGIMAEKYKKDSIESNFNNLKNKINPHFLFNTFNALSEVIEENPPKASKLVSELSDVYRYVFDNQETNWILLKREIEFVYAYINLFKMRFEDNLDTEILIEAEYLEYYIAPLTIQILIENAIKHNEISSKKPFKITIEVENNHLKVSNNLQLKKIINSGSSFGLTNLKERYKHLSNKAVEIIQSETEFTVKIPLIKDIREPSKKQAKREQQHSFNKIEKL